MQKFILLLAFFSLTTLSLDAQTYKNEIGLRGGYYGNGGVTFKHWLNESNAIEVIGFGRFYASYSYLEINGLYEKHTPIADVEGLSWYWGVGGFVGFSSYNDTYYGTVDSTTSLGITGVGGVTYQFSNIPLSVAVDWMPRIALSRGAFYGGFFGSRGGGAAVRYAFGG